MERRKFTREFKLEAVRLIKVRGVSYGQASQDLNVHVSQLGDWVKKFSDDPQHASPAKVRWKPEQLEIARIKREAAKLKAQISLAASRETNLRRERQLEGIAKAKAAGVYKGRRPTIDRDEIRAFLQQGMKPSAIAKHLKIGRASVYRLLGP